MATTIFHELTHALVAYALGVRSVLHHYAAVRAGEASFWVFAAIGAVARPGSQGRGQADHLRWTDAAGLLVTIVIVRLLVAGIPFVP
jgi:hypothetical protein